MFFKDPFWGAYFWRGLSMEWNLHFKIGWVSLIVGKKFTIFALFHFVFEGNFQVQALGGGGGGWGLYLEGWFNGGFFALWVWGNYIWRGLFSEFYIYISWMFDLYKCVYINAHYIFKKNCQLVLLGCWRTPCIESTLFHHFSCMESY